MEEKAPVYYQDVEKCVDDLIEKVGKKVVIAIPLALAKPNQLVNSLYRRLRTDPELHLTIITAVSLEKPTWSSDLEKRFLKPIVERVWEDFPDFEYMLDLRKDKLPKNFELIEFYNKTAGFMNSPHAQMNYLGSNYTHAIRDGMINGCNVVAQLISKKEMDGELRYSMGSNPDTHLEAAALKKELEKQGKNIAIIGQVHDELPFMYGKGVIKPSHYDMVIDSPEYNFKLFGAPKASVSSADWMIGLHASSLVKDGGTLQVGIGSLGDAVVSGLMMRHKENKVYNEFLENTGVKKKFKNIIESTGGTDVFAEGLLCSSEMFVDTIIHLFKEGIVKRKVYENAPLQRLINDKKITDEVTPDTLKALLASKAIHGKIKEKDFNFLTKYGVLKDDLTYEDGKIINGKDTYSNDFTDEENLSKVINNCLGDKLKNGIAVYASFFIGPQDFYETLRSLTEEERKLIDMRGVDYVNQLYGNDQEIKVLQRKNGRFINAALKVNMAGAVTADALEDHKIISGPGGQYNFVSMAHALPDGRAITMIRSARGGGKNAMSNIVWQYGHITIPRHLRDIVITEYGIADLRGRKDKDVMAALINVADSRFQDELLAKAKQMKKMPEDYEIPEEFRNNYPQTIENNLKEYRAKGYFPPFPFGTDFTDEEIVIGKSLKGLKAQFANSSVKTGLNIVKQIISPVPEKAKPYLKRMDLDSPSSLKEKMYQKVVTYALKSSGGLR
ncbi:MAG: hypothetical protein GY714_03035 [Desulfobacterales bacterium]|nr:hypothetical protein [Desulfobacterales bacterium]MCP4158646.1 hypothetical protein [Deltaproteobacteria bacterium]